MNKFIRASRVFTTTAIFCTVVVPLVMFMLSILAGEADVLYAIYGAMLGIVGGILLGLLFGLASLLSPIKDPA
jgi:energy-converting hydrogenase Eha subunit A